MYSLNYFNINKKKTTTKCVYGKIFLNLFSIKIILIDKNSKEGGLYFKFFILKVIYSRITQKIIIHLTNHKFSNVNFNFNYLKNYI